MTPLPTDGYLRILPKHRKVSCKLRELQENKKISDPIYNRLRATGSQPLAQPPPPVLKSNINSPSHIGPAHASQIPNTLLKQ